MPQYLHGVQVVEKTNATRAIRTINTGIIGIVGTAPDAAPATAATASTGTVAANNGITYTAPLGAAGNGVRIALVHPQANSAALSITVLNGVITVSLASNAAGVITTTAAQVIAAINAHPQASPLLTASNTGASTGVGVVPVTVKQVPLVGGSDEPFPLDTPVLVVGDKAQAAKLDATGNGLGTLPMSMTAIFEQIAPIMVVIRVAEGANAAATQSNIIGTVTAAGISTGMQALLTAKSKLGVQPRILGAPGWTSFQPVAAAMDAITADLKAFAYYDLASADVPTALTDRAAYGNKRCMLLFPGFEIWDTATNSLVQQPASARAMGLRAKLDNDVGWHKTLSNIPVNGVSGMTKPVSWGLQNANSQANLLNANEITTIIEQNGYRFWGSRTPSADPVFAFESTVRTGDVLADSIASAHLWAMDKPMSSVLFDEIVEGINAKFRELKASGYIVDAKAWLNPDLNTATSMSAGQLWIDYDYTAVPPLEQLGFNATVTNTYMIELLPKP